jgi:hypothetical protein
MNLITLIGSMTIDPTRDAFPLSIDIPENHAVSTFWTGFSCAFLREDLLWFEPLWTIPMFYYLITISSGITTLANLVMTSTSHTNVGHLVASW